MKNGNTKIERPPVVCIMGHIDHGKSKLLDYIRHTNIVDKEAGGITQKVSAYEVIRKTKNGDKKITFLDTPGHEAFGAIRSRGVEVADIAILVVSAEDGVKPQTLEALKVIVEHNLPYLVAISKIDKPTADVERAKMSLTENGIYLEGYGGNISYVPISAKTGEGIEALLDLLLLTAEVEELTGEPEALALGSVIETTMDNQKGIAATLIIKNGTLKSGMYVVAGDSVASTRIMQSFLGEKIVEATFSSPIRIVGFSKLPKVGAKFQTYLNKKEAETAANDYREAEPVKKVGVKKIDLAEGEEAPKVTDLNVVIKAENMGAIEGIIHEIEKIKVDYTNIKIVSSGIGDINENDIKMAGSKTGTIVVGFDVKIDALARSLAERTGVRINIFDIIYKLTEWLQELSLANKPIIKVEEMVARAKVLKVFSSVKDKYLFGGRVEHGTLEVGSEIKLLRNEVEIGRGKVKELQQQKDKASEVREGVEFGCQLQVNVPPAPGDKIESYKIIEK